MSSACSTARACRWRSWACRPRTAARPRPTAARSGRSSLSIIICSAARRRRCGSTGCSPNASASTNGSRPSTADHYYDSIDAALKTPGLPPARAVRAFRHRGDRDHREPARPARPSPRDPRERLERPGDDGLSSRSGDGPGGRRLPRQYRALRRDRGRGYRDLRRAISARTSSTARASARPGRPRPITATPAPSPRTSPPPRPKRSTRRSAPARRAPPRPSCSAARC